MVTFLNEVFIGRTRIILVTILVLNLLVYANIYICSIGLVNTLVATEKNEEEEKVNTVKTEKNSSVEFEAGVERILSGNESFYYDQQAEIISKTEMDAENGIMTVKRILQGSEDQQERVISEIQIDIETFETKVVTAEKDLSAKFETGVSPILSGNESFYYDQQAEIISKTEINAENGIMTVKRILQGSEGQQERMISEIQIDIETFETKVVMMDKNYRKTISTHVEEKMEFDIAYVTEGIQSDIINYEDALAKVPEEMQVPSDGSFISAFGPSEQYVYLVEEEEEMILARVIEAEAGDQDLVGKVLVGAVVLNRREAVGRFGNTITGVITAGGQFASISDIKNPNQECILAAQMALKGWDPSRLVFEDGALYFHTPNAHVSDRKNVVLKLQIGGHYCAREYGR